MSQLPNVDDKFLPPTEKYEVQLKGIEWNTYTRHTTLEDARKHRQATISRGRWADSVRIRKVTITTSERFEVVPDLPVVTSAVVLVQYSDGGQVSYPVGSVSVQYDPLAESVPLSTTTVIPPKKGRAVIVYE